MKFVRLYSNRPRVFPPIVFRLTGLNVVLATVRKPDNPNRDTHSLGKTLLAHFLDFMLLKEVDRDFFTRKNAARFADFVFFLELLLPDGVSHVTIRRPCATDTKISLLRHERVDGTMPFVNLEDAHWDHLNLAIGKATELLDGYLAFDVLPKRWDYRKGVSYFLRTQHDYRDPFRVEKFQRAKDVEWKPYVADLLGLPGRYVERKYKADQAAEGSEQGALVLAQTASYKENDYDRVKALIERKEIEARQREAQLSTFSFHEAEMEISDDLVSSVEAGIGRVEQQRYYKKRDLETAKEGLANPLKFETDEVAELYRECQINLPDQLVRSYGELESFNRQLVQERNKYLKRRIVTLEAEVEQLRVQHEELSARRQNYLQVLKNKESMQRYKRLQLEALRMAEELQQMKQQLERLGDIAELRSKGREAERSAQVLADRIERAVYTPPEQFTSIRQRFGWIVDECLKKAAVLYVNQNAERNIEFHADIERSTGSMELTSESEGSTYTKFLCIAFDLSVLAEYANHRFFHFVYHDGALEGLDNRKKLQLLRVVDEYCQRYNIQYILSAIQHELPHTADGKIREFPKAEIIRELHDNGDSGRLFRMGIF